MSSTSAREWSKMFPDQTNDKHSGSRSLQSVIDQLAGHPSSDKPDYLGYSSQNYPENSPGNSTYSWHRRLGLTKSPKTSNMPKLYEPNGHPRRQYKIGDIVLPHPRRSDLTTIDEGIVLSEVLATGQLVLDPNYQELLVYFIAKDANLYTEARRYARSKVMEPNSKPIGIQISNIDLQFIRSEESWLNIPDIEEVQIMRFLDIGDEL